MTTRYAMSCWGLVVALGLVGCGEDSLDPDGAGPVTVIDDSDAGIEPDARVISSDAGSDASGDMGAEGAPDAGDLGASSVCGDGVVSDGEACDDGNRDDGDYCSADCRVISGACGDATVHANEACDDGNRDDGDYCSADCTTVTGACGDGQVQSNEACDDGNTSGTDYCSANCSAQTGSCGDGTVQANESCDDGVIVTGCDVAQDGGDGACVAPGTCSPDFLMVDGKCEPEDLDFHVHIDVANNCDMTVTPAEVIVPAGQTVYVDWHNHSQWYEVDVWLSYGGGFLDLATGATWDEPINHCGNVNPYTAYADISTACSQHRFYIRCL